MSKSYVMAIPANELVSADAAGLDALIATNPDAYTDGTIIKIVAGVDAAGDPVVGSDVLLFVVIADKTVNAATLA